jgi:hypothetical protein
VKKKRAKKRPATSSAAKDAQAKKAVTPRRQVSKRTATKKQATGNAFLAAFAQEPGYPDWYSQVVPKPIFKQSSVCAEIWEDGQVLQTGNAARKPTITVRAYCENGNGLGTYQDKAWSHFLERAEHYESRLRSLLWTRAKQNFHAAVEANAADSTINPPGRWEEVTTLADFTKAESLDLQVSLGEIGLIDQGPQRTGFICFDFQIGWDGEHGLSILMHRGKIVGVGGKADFYNRGSALVPHLAYCRS